VKGEHGSVQNSPSVVKDVLAWIQERPLSLPDTPAGALSSHLAAPSMSAAPNLDGSARLNPHDDEYDRYRDLSEERIQELVSEFVAGKLPAVDMARIL
jgi:hypothetical protein